MSLNVITVTLNINGEYRGTGQRVSSLNIHLTHFTDIYKHILLKYNITLHYEDKLNCSLQSDVIFSLNFSYLTIFAQFHVDIGTK